MSRLFSSGILVFALLLVVGALGRSAPAEKPAQASANAPGAYIGAERCRSCHAVSTEKWEKSAHARAYNSLPPDRQKDFKCLSCHSPDPNGEARGVQCESCHGAGRDYSYDFVMKDRQLAKLLGLREAGEKQCRACHVPELGTFDYPAKLKLILHGSH
jgi:hypothetical protein